MAQLILLKGVPMSRRVIKRKKHTEQYNRQKLHSSIHAACLSVREFTGSAEITAEHVCSHVDEWLIDKLEVTSHDLRIAAGRFLEQYNPSAAVVYVSHMNVN